MLEEIVKLRTAQERLQQQISSMKLRAHVSDASVAAIEREAAHSASRQSATQRRLERLMMFTYELYKSLWLVHQRSNRHVTATPSAQGTAQPMLTDGTLLDADAAGDAVQSIFFSADGLVSPEQFVRMLDYVDVDTPAFAAMHRDQQGNSASGPLGAAPAPAGVLRLRDGALNEPPAIAAEFHPPALGDPVLAAGAFARASDVVKDLASDAPPAPKQARLQVGDGSSLRQKSTVQQIAALGASQGGATPAPPGIFTSGGPAAAPPAPLSSQALETNSLPPAPLLDGLSPNTAISWGGAAQLFAPGSSMHSGQTLGPPPLGAAVKSPLQPVHSGASNSPLAIDSLADESEFKAMAADKFAAELSSLVNVQDELASAEHTLLGNLATTDAQLASDFPDEHAAFALRDGDSGSHSGGSDPAGLRLVDLDLE